MSGAEGTRGGSDNRPGARAEIQKFARSVCKRCRLAGCAPIVVNNLCTNTGACDKRVRKWERDNPPPPPAPLTPKPADAAQAPKVRGKR